MFGECTRSLLALRWMSLGTGQFKERQEGGLDSRMRRVCKRKGVLGCC